MVERKSEELRLTALDYVRRGKPVPSDIHEETIKNNPVTAKETPSSHVDSDSSYSPTFSTDGPVSDLSTGVGILPEKRINIR